MRIRAVADVRSPCDWEIRSGKLADKLRHIWCQLAALHLREGSEENAVDLLKSMHHFQLGQKRNHLRNAAAHGFKEQDFSVEIRLKVRSGELQKTADISADQHTLHMAALQEGAWQVEKAGGLMGKGILKQGNLFGTVVIQQISNLIQHRLVSGCDRDGIDNCREITIAPESFAMSPPEISKISVISGSR